MPVSKPENFKLGHYPASNRIVRILWQEYYSRNHSSPEDVGPSNYPEASPFFGCIRCCELDAAWITHYHFPVVNIGSAV